MSAPDCTANKSRDLSRQPLSMTFWWVLPIVIGASAGFMRLSIVETAFVWALAFAWMGTGCVLNARRCGRLHCFISGPVLWLGAIAAGLVGLGLLSGSHVLDYAVWSTTALVLLSFLPELLWGKYARRS